MSRETGEAAILTKVRTCTGFDSTNSARMNWKLLDSGASDHYVILKSGEENYEWLTIKQRQDNYITEIQIWQRYTDETTSQTNLETYKEYLKALFTTPHMGATATVFDSNLMGFSEIEEMWGAGGNGPFWLRRIGRLAWSEITEVTFSE